MRGPRVVPARYQSVLEGAESRVVDLIELDIHRRANGEEPLIPDVAIDEWRDGWAFIVTGQVNDRLLDVATQAAERSRERRKRPA